MKWYCTNCGSIYDEDDLDELICPHCDGGMEECERCGWCNEWRNPETMMWFPCTGFDSICPECFKRECEPYKDEFLAKPMGDPEDPSFTWGQQFEDIKSVPVFKVNDFFDFIRWEEEANCKFFDFVKLKKLREAVERGKKSNVKVNYIETRR